MEYSEIVLEHFHAPRNGYRMKEPSVTGIAGTPERGPFMLLYLRVEGERIEDASYQTYGCGPAIAAGSLITERLQGSARDEAALWSEKEINEALGGLPPAKRHCSALAASALKDALQHWAATRKNPTATPYPGEENPHADARDH